MKIIGLFCTCAIDSKSQSLASDKAPFTVEARVSSVVSRPYLGRVSTDTDHDCVGEFDMAPAC